MSIRDLERANARLSRSVSTLKDLNARKAQLEAELATHESGKARASALRDAERTRRVAAKAAEQAALAQRRAVALDRRTRGEANMRARLAREQRAEMVGEIQRLHAWMAALAGRPKPRLGADELPALDELEALMGEVEAQVQAAPDLQEEAEISTLSAPELSPILAAALVATGNSLCGGTVLGALAAQGGPAARLANRLGVPPHEELVVVVDDTTTGEFLSGWVLTDRALRAQCTVTWPGRRTTFELALRGLAGTSLRLEPRGIAVGRDLGLPVSEYGAELVSMLRLLER